MASPISGNELPSPVEEMDVTGYNKYYKSENLFGKPYPELIRYFRDLEYRGKLLDLGCGQGRNAIPLARQGYDVTGIDISDVGIGQMNRKSVREKLPMKGIVGDMHRFNRFHEFDIILLDSVLLFDKKQKKRECILVERIAKEIRKRKLICICIKDTGVNVQILKDTVVHTGIEFETLFDIPLIRVYEDEIRERSSISSYRMLVFRKTSGGSATSAASV